MVTNYMHRWCVDIKQYLLTVLSTISTQGREQPLPSEAVGGGPEAAGRGAGAARGPGEAGARQHEA